eukprot:364639-Chlamydomonas_euryale.AAC.32
MGRRPDGPLHPTAQMCAAEGVPQLIHILSAAQLTLLGHGARMPDESVDRVQQLCARFSRPGWRGGVGIGWLRTTRNGVPFVTAPYPHSNAEEITQRCLTHSALLRSTQATPSWVCSLEL